ncbi:hypothetical protein PoB_002549900 [Plakobranchus ocellatus]|uniref:Uncharacterized protein n=1 Tax=Plakobranchus ocellatus TaxID=259542 RepID=A0AAV3ZYJ4_9GAST|nr:hypothetical protein PoB_002549900 [Plakobranchus ocellatus]
MMRAIDSGYLGETLVWLFSVIFRGVDDTVASASALQSAGNLLSWARASPPALWPDGGPESLRSPCCGLAIYRTPNPKPQSTRLEYHQPGAFVRPIRGPNSSLQLPSGRVVMDSDWVIFLGNGCLAGKYWLGFWLLSNQSIFSPSNNSILLQGNGYDFDYSLST